VTRDYELGFILYPEVSEEEIGSVLGRIEQIVANHGGQIVQVNQWGRRRLAYPIQHHRDGYYIFIDMILTPETVAELERTLTVSEIVLRHMVKRRDPKAVQKERQEREARAAAASVAAANAESTTIASSAPAEAASAEETESPVVELSEEEMAAIPPAIDEEEEEGIQA
jgi:small subunit ribosomal protein S6